MKQYSILLGALLRNTFSPAASGAANDPRARRKAVGKVVLYAFLAIYVMAIMFIYFYSLAGVLAASGRIESFVPLAFLIAAALSFVMALAHSPGYIYGCRDFEMLSAMPVSSRTIFLSKFTLLYGELTIASLLGSLPCFICYAIFASPPVWFYLIAFVMILFAPALGLVLGGLVAYLITLFTIGVGAKNKVMLVLNFSMVLLIMYFSMKWSFSMSQTGSTESMADNLSRIAALSPFAGLITAAAAGNIISLLLFVAGNGLILAAGAFLIGGGFIRANARMGESGRRTVFKGQRLNQSSRLKALYKKELSAYFSQYIYVMNTAFGFVLMLIGAVILLFKAGELSALFETGMAGGKQALAGMIILIVTFCTTLTSTTSSAISMEGASFWIVRSMPVTATGLLGSKMLVWLTVSLPATLISIIMVALSFKLSLVASVMLCLYAAACCVACGLWGLAIDLANPKLNWTSAVNVVKQSTAVLYSMLVGMLLTGIMAVAIMVLELPVLLVLGGATLVLAAYSAAQWALLIKNTDKRLLELVN